MKRTFHRKDAHGNPVALVTLDTKDLEPDDDLYRESALIASQMGLIGELRAEAEADLEVAERALESWEAQAACDFMGMEGNEGIAQWKVEKLVKGSREEVETGAQGEMAESRLTYRGMVTVVSRYKAAVSFLKTYTLALSLKSSQVRARTELRRQKLMGLDRGTYGESADQDEDSSPPPTKPVTSGAREPNPPADTPRRGRKPDYRERKTRIQGRMKRST